MSKVINQSHKGNILHDIDFSATSQSSIGTDGVIEFYTIKGAVVRISVNVTSLFRIKLTA